MRSEYRMVIHRPIEEVWAFILDSFSNPRWLSFMLRGWRWSGPMGVGTQGRARFSLLGFEGDGTTTVTEYDPPRLIAHTQAFGRLGSAKRRVTLRPTPAGTEYFAMTDLELRQPLKAFWPLIGQFFERRIEADMKRLKELIEVGEGAG